MEISRIPEAFESKIRLAVLTALLNGDKNFGELKEITKATDGNLSTHLGKLEKDGYIIISKSFVNKKPKTECSLTEKGRNELVEYINLLNSLLKTSD